MKKSALALISLILFISSCAPQPTPLISVTETLSPVPTSTLTPTPLPAISPAEWASNESGTVIPQKMFPLMGAVDKKHRRTLDLEYLGLRLAVVLGEGVDLQDSSFIAKHREIRSIYADELSQQETLIEQLAQVKAMLDKQGITQDSVVIIEGQNWPDDVSISPTAAFVSHVVEFVKNKPDEIKAIYTWENEKLSQLSQEELPQLLPELRVSGPYIERADTGEQVWLKGLVFLLHERKPYESIFDNVKRYIEENERNGLYSNYVRLSDYSKAWGPNETDEIKRTVEYLESRGYYVTFTAHNDQRSPTTDNQFMPNEKDKQTVIDVYTAIANQSNVIIGTWNEPDTGWNKGWTPWTNVLSEMYERLVPIYEGKKMPPILVPGIGWARDHRNSIIPLPENSFIRDIHPYAIPTGATTYEHVDYMWTHVIGQQPILMTELSGIVYNFDTQQYIAAHQSPKDIQNVEHILKIINDPNSSRMIGYAVFGADTLSENDLSRLGKAILKERTEFPPTDFTK